MCATPESSVVAPASDGPTAPSSPGVGEPCRSRSSARGRRGWGTAVRLGVLDVGSNSVKLQIADGRSGAPPLETSVFKDTVRLAERETDDGVIDQAGVERLVDVVRRAVRVSDRENV